MNIHGKFVSLAFATLLLAACGGADINGTYSKTDSALTIKFDHGKAFITGLNSMDTTEGTYTVSGNKITVDGPDKHPHLVFTRNNDGTLHFDTIGGTLTKTASGS